jgi:hypothetical protein
MTAPLHRQSVRDHCRCLRYQESVPSFNGADGSRECFKQLTNCQRIEKIEYPTASPLRNSAREGAADRFDRLAERSSHV